MREGEREGQNGIERKKWQKEKEQDGSLWISGLIASLLRLSEREATQHSLPRDQQIQYRSLSPPLPSLSLSTPLPSNCFGVCVSLFLSLQCLLSKLIRASQLKSQRVERHSELLLSLSPRSFPSFLPSLLFFSSCLLFHPLIPHVICPSFIFSPTSPSLQLHHLIPFLPPSPGIIFINPLPSKPPSPLPPLSSLPSPSGLRGELDKWAVVDGWGVAGQEDFQSTQ